MQKINAAEWLAWHVKKPFREGGGGGGGGGCHPSLEKGEFETVQDDFLHSRTCLSYFFKLDIDVKISSKILLLRLITIHKVDDAK